MEFCYYSKVERNGGKGETQWGALIMMKNISWFELIRYENETHKNNSWLTMVIKKWYYNYS